MDFSQWLRQTEKALGEHLSLLTQLAEGSVDYTLHLNVDFGLERLSRVILPPNFLKVASLIGFTVEIYAAEPD